MVGQPARSGNRGIFMIMTHGGIFYGSVRMLCSTWQMGAETCNNFVTYNSCTCTYLTWGTFFPQDCHVTTVQSPYLQLFLFR